MKRTYYDTPEQTKAAMNHTLQAIAPGWTAEKVRAALLRSPLNKYPDPTAPGVEIVKAPSGKTGLWRRALTKAREDSLVALFRGGKSYDWLANHFNVSDKTVWRILHNRGLCGVRAPKGGAK